MATKKRQKNKKPDRKRSLAGSHSIHTKGTWSPWSIFKTILLICLWVTAIAFLIYSPEVLAAKIPGADVSDKMEAAGTLLRLVDTALFVWTRRILVGISVMGAAWALKEQRIGMVLILIIAALIFGTVPIWVKNIYSIGGGDGLFS